MPLNFLLTGAMIVLGAAVLAIAGTLATRKAIDHQKLRASHDVSGYMLSVVGALYAVLLGLIVVDAMQQYQRAREITELEANNLADVFILAKGMPEPHRSRLQGMCRSYTDQVIATEWDRMHAGSFCPIARGKAIELMSSLMGCEPHAENEKAIYPQLISEASQFWQHRQARLSISGKGVPVVEWVVLITGAIITVFFTYFFALEHVKLQLLMTSMVAMLIALNLTLLLYYAYPFGSDTGITDESFKSLKEMFATQPN